LAHQHEWRDVGTAKSLFVFASMVPACLYTASACEFIIELLVESVAVRRCLFVSEQMCVLLAEDT